MIVFNLVNLIKSGNFFKCFKSRNFIISKFFNSLMKSIFSNLLILHKPICFKDFKSFNSCKSQLEFHNNSNFSKFNFLRNSKLFNLIFLKDNDFKVAISDIFH